MVKAVIDVGSNSVLLTVAKWEGSGMTAVLEDTAVTSLGEGTKESGRLGEPGMTATLAALRKFFDSAQRAGATEIRACATMAARLARNAAEFVERAASQGTPVEVISGEREAELGFMCVAEDPAFHNFERFSIVDVGGQSTEIAIATRGDGEPSFRKSFPIGTLALRSELSNKEILTAEDIFRASLLVDRVLDWGELKVEHVVVLGATGTNLIAIREQMLDWQPDRVHGAKLDYEEVSKAVSWLSALSDEGRAAVPGMEKGRERTIHLGALILERALYALKASECYVNIRGWRYGLLAEMVSAPT